jgi:hypothetical protein
MKNLMTYESFISGSDYSSHDTLDEGIMKFLTGYDSKKEKTAAIAKFEKALEDAEKEVKANPEKFADSVVKNWDVQKAFILGKASANKYLGGVTVEMSKGDEDKNPNYGKYFVIYKEGVTGFEGIASAAKPGIGATLGKKA